MIINIPQNSKFLKGTGASAWFYIEKLQNKHEYEISRYSEEGELECKNAFQLQNRGFNISEDYEITYVSHCAKCTVIQNNTKFVFIKVN